MEMTKKSRAFFLVFFLIFIGSIGLAYYRYYIQRDYIITSQAACDPYVETCFVSLCDSNEDECSENPDENISYYKDISRNAKNVPVCNPTEEGCSALSCPVGETDCEVTLCDTNVNGSIVCSDPQSYRPLYPENPEEEEGLPSNQDN